MQLTYIISTITHHHVTLILGKQLSKIPSYSMDEFYGILFVNEITKRSEHDSKHNMICITQELQTKGADRHGHFQFDSILDQILIQTHLTGAEIIQSVIPTPCLINRRDIWQQCVCVCDRVLKKTGYCNIPLQLIGKWDSLIILYKKTKTSPPCLDYVEIICIPDSLHCHCLCFLFDRIDMSAS